MKLKNWLVLASVIILQPLTPNMALAKKKSPPKAFSFIVEGGKASQGECDGERKIPRKLKHQKEMAKFGSYMGSELQDPPIKGKPGEEMWKHFFRAKPACNAALGKTPSSLDQSLQKDKKELPEDDSADTDDEPENGNGKTDGGPDSGPDTE